ncbi:MAG: cytochrome c1 [Pseudomonadaceae bacterium]|nr:cytochrome c1 [Pseudomonadaceae bacterium]
MNVMSSQTSASTGGNQSGLRSAKRLLGVAFGSLIMLLSVPALAAGAAYEGEHFEADLNDLPSMQRGFKMYVNYCIGCHSLQYQRYEKTADDLGIPHEIALENLVFTGQRIGGLMVNAMAEKDAKAWFGGKAPDLTMIDRIKGSSYIYNYLKTFYADDSRPLGFNNLAFPNVGMPHVMAELQGIQRNNVCLQEPVIAENGGEKRDPLSGEPITEEVCDNLVVDEGTGSLSAEEYDQVVADITNFLHYVGEPARADRNRIGVFVLLFLVIMFALAWLLNREYWKDVEH